MNGLKEVARGFSPDTEQLLLECGHSKTLAVWRMLRDKAGQPKNGDGLGPLNRRDPSWTTNQMQTWKQMLSRLEDMEKTEGVMVGPWDRS